VLRDIPYAAVMAAWDRSLFGVAPSLWPEPFGNVIHEGMSCGRAMIGTTPGGHADMIDHMKTGLLVPAGDVEALRTAMQQLIDDTPFRQRLGDAARAAAEQFSASVQLPRFERLYQAVLEQNKGV
jgi:glycosyltransferase involved in cell wall biosynthesis